MSRIFVTGMGVMSAIGDTVNANRTSLMRGTCGISTLQLFPSRFSGIMPFGEIKTSTADLQAIWQANEPGVTRTMVLACAAFEEALADSGLTVAQIQSPHTALIGASTVGGMCLTDELYHDSNKAENGSEYLSSYDCASVTLYLQARHKMLGIVNTINTACSSSANAILFGARLIRNGIVSKAIVGGADSLAKFTINGFNALHILAPEVCKPFDQNRKGLNLGEGAAFLVLEKEADVIGKKVYAELTGFGNSSDAYHPSSLSEQGDGPYLSMKEALIGANIAASEIGFINAHGTGTENNDEVESKAMLRLFNEPPPFASTKSNIGHTLGAAGAIEAVYSILNLEYQEVYPALNFTQPIAATGMKPVQAYQSLALKHVMSNSFGFGGNCTSLIFSKV